VKLARRKPWTVSSRNRDEQRLALTNAIGKAEDNRKFRNCYRVLYRVSAHGPMNLKPAKLLLFLTGINTPKERRV
jgi:hypothetical protein